MLRAPENGRKEQADDKLYFFMLIKKDMSWIYLNSGWLEVPWGDGDLGMVFTLTKLYLSTNGNVFCSSSRMFTEQGGLSPCKVCTRCPRTSLVSKYSQESPPVREALAFDEHGESYRYFVK